MLARHRLEDGRLLKRCSWSLVPAETREKYISGAKADSAPVIDLLSHGYAKLLGKGKDMIQSWETAGERGRQSELIGDIQAGFPRSPLSSGRGT